MERPVIIVEYDPTWPIKYKNEKARISKVIGHKIKAFEHIGSTAVPGLGAKPIVDMMAGVYDITNAQECVKLLQQHLGFIDITPVPDDPEWFYCIGNKTKLDDINTIHLHLIRYESNHWKKHIMFRDYLRAHPDVAQQYYEFKKKLAAKYRNDRRAYADAKKSFVESVIERGHQKLGY